MSDLRRVRIAEDAAFAAAIAAVDHPPIRSLAVPWVAFTVDGPWRYRVCDFARDYSFHATAEAARGALRAASDAQLAFAGEELARRHPVSLDGCGACGAAVLVDLSTRRARCAAGCGWTGVALRRLP